MSQPIHNPQRGAARALLELLAEFPELPALRWDIGSDGFLRGSLHGPNVTSDAEAWATALGYDGLREPFGYRYNDADREFQTIHMVWRDVELSLGFYSECPEVSARISVVAA